MKLKKGSQYESFLEKIAEENDINKFKNKLFNLPFCINNETSNEDSADVDFPHLLFSLLFNINDKTNEEQQTEFVENVLKIKSGNDKNIDFKICKSRNNSIENNDDIDSNNISNNRNDVNGSNGDVDDNEKDEIPPEFFPLKKQIVHLKKIINDQNIFTASIHKYAKKNFSNKIDILLYYIIEPILNDVLFLPRILELLRLVETSTNQDIFKKSLLSALTRFKKTNKLNDNIILVLQSAFALDIISMSTAHQISMAIIPTEYMEKYDHLFEFKFYKSKIGSLNKNKEIYNLKQQIASFQSLVGSNENKQEQEHIYNTFLNTILQNQNRKPEGRRYNDYFLSACTIAYIYGAKSYNFLRNFLPLPNETVLRDWFSPSINSFLEKVFDISKISDIIEIFISENDLSKGFNATVAVEAAKFKEIKGDKLIQFLPECLKMIIPDAMYNDIFVYYLQTVEINAKPFPIHIQLTENGNASLSTIKTISMIEQILSQKRICTRYVATDGDKQFDGIHDEFFKIIWNLISSGKSFQEIIEILINDDTIRIPISDFYHSIKLLRSNFAKSGVMLNDYATSKPEDIADSSYNLGKTLIDLSQTGKMKDHYPLTLFSIVSRSKITNGILFFMQHHLTLLLLQ
ncbi:hypothetical protein M9Y10_040434 [Tritrichomonas musculus]|uniref:Reverse transcriptase domain-containing protein n=1 Tax=Tritrichomonas musculus TaxID=1915356 RepID=A0ABR2GQD5_9EUKA